MNSITLSLLFSLNLLITSCNSKIPIENNTQERLEYKIIKIDSTSKTYIIHVKENDTYYKVLSLKANSNNPTGKKIKTNKKYKLKLISLEVPLYVDGLDFHGEPIWIEKDSIYDLHITNNLKGLYFIEE